ncbi:MAG TPA: 1-acyl-sn-glycerol-3-phosphate acyltransferase [Bacteroidales bacterium]|nr:1-acyl-sn-glycerol-3-phosphate acyltransferase [Bacteroidales bacterium]HRZ48271.1 1-acyl-sn-glycerol-3-phosphate acyltransferase [Bacteroidales bacterium]
MQDTAGTTPSREGDGLVITRKTIDIRKVFGSKNQKLAALMPGFVFRYIRRIIHEDELNDFLWKNRDKSGLDFVEVALKNFEVQLEVHGLENLPAQGRCTVVSNHPLGGLDGIALMHILGNVRKDVVTPANDLLMFLPNLRSLFVPINKHGRNNENIALINSAFGSDNLMLYFPAGLCSRKQKGGVICDLEWKSTFISKSVRNQRTVIPVHFKGNNSQFFYNLARLRKWLGIKANIEMFYLVNEMFKHRKRKFVITIGTPIPPSFFDRSKKPAAWADWVKREVYRLGNEPIVG